MAAPTSYRRVLRHTTARRLWTATAVSGLGDFVGSGALILLAFDRAGGVALGPGALFTSAAIGSLTMAVLGGSLLDRVSRHAGLIAGQVIGAISVALPLLLPGLAPVYGAAALLGAVRTATASIRSGAMAEAVPDDLRGGLIALLGASGHFGEVLGLTVGAGVAIAIGPAPAIIADIVTFVIGAAVLTRAGLPRTHHATRAIPLSGLAVVWRHPHLRLIAVMVFLTTTTTAMPESVATVATAADPGWTPFVLAAAPAGAALGYLLVGRFHGAATFARQLLHLTCYAATFALALALSGPVGLLITNVAIGVGAAWLVGPQLTFIRLAPAGRMAQVTASMVAVMSLSEGVGTFALASVADRVSVVAAYVTAGALVSAAALVGWIARTRGGVIAGHELDHLVPADEALADAHGRLA